MYSYPNYIPLNARAVAADRRDASSRSSSSRSTADGSGATSCAARQAGGPLLGPPLPARDLGSWTVLSDERPPARGGGALAGGPAPRPGGAAPGANGRPSAQRQRAGARPEPRGSAVARLPQSPAAAASRSTACASGSPPRLEAVSVSGGGLARVPRRRERADPRRHRHRQDLRGVDGAGARVAARLSRSRAAPRRRERAAAAPRPLDHAAPRARRRHRGRAPRADRGSRPALDRRVAHRRHPRPRSARASASGCRPRSSPRPRACRCCSPATTPPSCSITSSWSWWTSGTSCWPRSAACRPSSRWRGSAASGPELRTLGLSATLGNLDVARDALLGVGRRAARRGPAASCGASCPRRSRWTR